MNQNTTVDTGELYKETMLWIIAAGVVGFFTDVSFGTYPQVLATFDIPTIIIPDLQVVYVEAPVIMSPGMGILCVVSMGAMGHMVWRLVNNKSTQKEDNTES